MRKNVIVCDRCGKEFPADDRAYRGYREWSDYRVNGHDWDFCKECWAGFLDWVNNREKPVDRLREVEKMADNHRADAQKSSFDLARIGNEIVLFSDVRVERKTVPEGIYMYETRHTDEDWGEPFEICDGVLVNFYGTILSKKPFNLEPYGTLGNRRMDISFDDNFALLDGACTLQEYIDGTYKLDDEEDEK